MVEMTPGEPAVPMVSPTLLSPSLPNFNQGDSKIFLDICSGATRPLSSAILAQHGDVLSFDILLDQRMDLLNDGSYEQLLRICSSGQVAYGAASPSCAHYSRLKLHRPGPKALRTPEFLDGVPGLSSAELLNIAGTRIIHDAISNHYLPNFNLPSGRTCPLRATPLRHELVGGMCEVIFTAYFSLVHNHFCM